MLLPLLYTHTRTYTHHPRSHRQPKATRLHELVKALERLAAGLADLEVGQEGGAQVVLQIAAAMHTDAALNP